MKDYLKIVGGTTLVLVVFPLLSLLLLRLVMAFLVNPNIGQGAKLGVVVAVIAFSLANIVYFSVIGLTKR